MNDRPGIDPLRLFLGAACVLALWLGLAWWWHAAERAVPAILFRTQDAPALLIAIGGLVLLAPFGRGRWGNMPSPRTLVLALILIAALWAWGGHYAVFQDYALSRDEEVAEFAAAYLREGMIARPIPPEWIGYRRAIMPEFFSPYGASVYWTAAYLPVNSAIRAAFDWLGDADLAGPALLAAGLFALWRVALRLFPDSMDAVWVVMLTALTSAQLSVTAMTPYAMTGHFALNMIWLALVLRGGAVGHGGAAIVALVAGGLHQWHFPPIFIAPFLLWMLLGRRWAAFAFHGVVLALLVLIWAKLWPAFLLDHLGPPSDIRPTAGVGDKVGSLFTRLADKWQPLLNISRFLAWNNVLMVPLAILAVAGMRWRDALAGRSIILPLGLGCVIALALALHQGYGWGFRYAQGSIGAFCLLAGFGWQRLRAPSLRPVLLGGALSLVVAAFLTVRAHDYVAPYAAADRLVHATRADVVLVDPRGGMFVTDLVRGRHGVPGAPMVMNLSMLDADDVDALCARYTVAVLDWTAFRPLGVGPARWSNGRTALLRDRMVRRGCGTAMAVGG